MNRLKPLPMGSAARTKSDPVLPRRAATRDEQVLVLDNISWATYCTISDALGERYVRLTFDRGRLEFMTLSRRHEREKSFLGRLIDILTEEFDLPMQGVGSMTCRREDLLRGIEPDDSWYIASLPKVIDKGELDFSVDPPPDLATEIDVSRSSVDRLSIHQALRIPEVWRFDGTKLTVYVLSPEGVYQVVETSPTFPGIAIAEIVPFLLQGMNGDQNPVKKAFRQWVRKQLRKRKKT